MADLVVNTGKANITSSLTSSNNKYVSWGTGAGTTAAGNTTLFTEDYSTSSGGTGRTRVSGTQSQQTTTTTNDTYRVVATLTAEHTTAVTNAGIFDTNGESANSTTPPSGGTLFCKSDFSVVNLATSDSIAFTFNIAFS